MSDILTPEQVQKLRDEWFGVQSQPCDRFRPPDPYDVSCDTCSFSEAMHDLKRALASVEALRAELTRVTAERDELALQYRLLSEVKNADGTLINLWER
jgi:hypothetical protein